MKTVVSISIMALRPGIADFRFNGALVSLVSNQFALPYRFGIILLLFT